MLTILKNVSIDNVMLCLKERAETARTPFMNLVMLMPINDGEKMCAYTSVSIEWIP